MSPRITPLLNPDRPVLGRLRPYLTGAAGLTTDTLRGSLPDRFADATLTPAHRTEILSIPYLVGDSHIAKVITTRTLLAQNLYIRSLNIQARVHSLPPFLRGYLKPAHAAQYRYHALEDSFAQGGFVPEPVSLETNRYHSIVLTKYHSTTDSFNDVPKAVSTFRSALATLRTLHTQGYVHGSLFSHLFLSSRLHNVLMTDPLGRTTTDKYRVAQAFDVAGLLAKFAAPLGSLAVIQQPIFTLPDAVLQYLPGALRMLVSATEGHPVAWVADDIEQILAE